MVAPLTDRQREILRLIASGLGRRQVAHRLGISPNTLRVHVAAAYIRLGVSTEREAFRTLGWLTVVD